MYKEIQVDTSELKKLKGISIALTEDDQPFLVFTYKKREMSERVFAVVCWSAVAALYAICGFVFWWSLVR
jgi:hypothetical protein